MKMVCTGGPYGDACSSYDVELDRTCTVQEFIEMVLKEKQNEWGNFTITTDFQYIYKNQKDNCEYKHGKITDGFKKQKVYIKSYSAWRLDKYGLLYQN